MMTMMKDAMMRNKKYLLSQSMSKCECVNNISREKKISENIKINNGFVIGAKNVLRNKKIAKKKYFLIYIVK